MGYKNGLNFLNNTEDENFQTENSKEIRRFEPLKAKEEEPSNDVYDNQSSTSLDILKELLEENGIDESENLTNENENFDQNPIPIYPEDMVNKEKDVENSETFKENYVEDVEDTETINENAVEEIKIKDVEEKVKGTSSIKRRGAKPKNNPKRKPEEDPAECDVCAATFTTRRSMQRHYKTIHELQTADCNLCGRTFGGRDNLRTHIKTVHEKIRFPCTKCDRQFSQQYKLKEHKRNVHDPKCEFCKLSFENEEDFNRHIQEEHINKYA